jgi:hypothetical protein
MRYREPRAESRELLFLCKNNKEKERKKEMEDRAEQQTKVHSVTRHAKK